MASLSPVSGSDAAILGVTVTVNEVGYAGFITEDEIVVAIPKNADWQDIDVEITVSEGASIYPSVDEVSEWSSEQLFTVTSANGENVSEYKLRLEKEEGDTFDSIVMITNNTAMNAFAENGYETVGALYIRDDGGDDPIISTEVLGGIKVIKTELEIQTDRLETIEMESLESAGNIDVLALSLQSVNLPSLKNVAGRFRIGNDDSGPLPDEHLLLEAVSLKSLESVGRSFKLFFCPNIKTLDITSLKSVGEDVDIMGGHYSDLGFVRNLKSVNGIFRVTGELESLDGFGIETIGEGLYLDLSGVTSLAPLNVLKSVPYISLSNGPLVTSFEGLENISPTAIDISGLTAVTDLSGLPVSSTMEHLRLSGMSSLKSIEALSTLEAVGNLYLVDCPLVSDLSPLEGLNSVDNLTLSLMEGLEALPQFRFSSIEKLVLSMMSALTDISGLTSLEEAGSVQIDNIINLESLAGLENLRKITAGGLVIGNNGIKDLDPLRNLEEVIFAQQQDQILITMNSELVDYTGLADILIKYWNEYSGKQSRVSISQNKYNPTLEQLLNGEYVMVE